MKRNLAVAAIAMLLLLVAGPTAMAGEAERAVALAELREVEVTVYVGNAGSIGMDPTHPSVLFRLLDAKAKNDNSLIGSTDVLVEELAAVGLGIESLVPGDGDFELAQVESETLTGYTLTERLEFLRTNLQVVRVLLDDAGINNEAQKQLAIERTVGALADLDAIIALVDSHLAQ